MTVRAGPRTSEATQTLPSSQVFIYITRLFDYRRDDHLDDAAQAVVRADRSIAELTACGRLPVIARAVVLVVLRDAGKRRIVLLVASGHLVDHEVEGGDHDHAVPAASRFEKRVARRARHVPVRIDLEHQA